METRSRRRLANAPINKLGDDILVEILIRLPNPRYACRCKSVCKLWRSLISTPGFNRSFASHHQSKKLPLIPTDDPQDWRSSIIMSFLPALTYHERYGLSVMDCFKDLLLLGFVELPMLGSEMVRTFLVCNPFSKQWLALPVAPRQPAGCHWTASRLVCEPRLSHDVDLDNDIVVYSEYRFRVLTIYQHKASTKLDMFCSETGKWTSEALILHGYSILQDKIVCSCNAELFWSCLENNGYNLSRRDGANPLLASVNAFRLDIPVHIHACPLFDDTKEWDLAVSQATLHVILRETQTETVSVWRREQDGRSWTMQCEALLKLGTSSAVRHHDLKCYSILNIHPEKPEVVFFRYSPDYFSDGGTLSYNLRRGELEYVSTIMPYRPRWTLFQPRISCWPTPIPRYEELRGIYDGSMSCFRVAGNNNNNSLHAAHRNKRERPMINPYCQCREHRAAGNSNSLGTAHRNKRKRSSTRKQANSGVGLIAEPIEESQSILPMWLRRRWLRVK